MKLKSLIQLATLFLLSFFFLSTAQSNESSANEFNNAENEKMQSHLRWLEIEDRVSTIAANLVREKAVWKDQVINRGLASVDDREVENLKFWKSIESNNNEDPLYWLEQVDSLE
ncbi:MAG: hypothetical protein ACPGJV_10615 [Bacteriovoracaceae bacterium]